MCPERVTLPSASNASSIRRFQDRSEHFVGFCLANFDGRVCVNIVKLDVAARTGIMGSDGYYELVELVGPAGFDCDVEYAWKKVAGVMGIGQAWKDASDELMSGFRPVNVRHL